MDLSFFTFLVAAIALGVYIGREPQKHIDNLIFGFTRSIWVLLKMMVWLLPSLIAGYFSYQISLSILSSVISRSAYRQFMPPFLVVVGSGIIGLVSLLYIASLIFNIQKLGFKKGLTKTFNDSGNDR